MQGIANTFLAHSFVNFILQPAFPGIYNEDFV